MSTPVMWEISGRILHGPLFFVCLSRGAALRLSGRAGIITGKAALAAKREREAARNGDVFRGIKKEAREMIRRAEQKDIPELLRLLLQVNNVHAAGRPDLFRKDRRKYGAAELEEILRDGEKAVFVMTGDGDRIRGYAFTGTQRHQGESNQTDRVTLYIDDICVDEICRGQGVGKALFAHVTAFARNMGCHNLTLNVWCLNPGAMKFYEAMGMKPYKIGMETVLD